MLGSNTSKYVVPAFGARDEYQLPLALYEHDLLYRVIVEMRPSQANRIKRWAARSDTTLRSEQIPASFFEAERRALATGVLAKVRARIGFRNSYYDWLEAARFLGERAAEVAKRHSCNVAADLYSAGWCFQNMVESPSRKVLFQTHPHISFLLRLYGRKAELFENSLAALPIATEPDIGAPLPHRDALEGAPRAADLIICASQFSKRSLVESGISSSKVAVVEYGVDATRFYPDELRSSSTFRLIFVGQASDRKNISRLLTAWEACRLPNAELVLVGADFAPNSSLGQRSGIVCLGRVSDERLRQQLCAADALILPSIAEGFGLVILQSLACGTPVIASENTGLPDILANFDVGELIPEHALSDLSTVILSAFEGRASLLRKRPSCIAAAKYYSWPRFRARVAEAVL